MTLSSLEDDFINGMLVFVESFDGTLRVRTNTGHRLAIFKWTDTEHGGVSYYPLRYAWASTIDKNQGAEFTHITIYADCENRPAAGYTALSRVSSRQDYAIAGNPVVRPSHFVPAQ